MQNNQKGTAPRRNQIVKRFGTPDETVGSLNDPRLQSESGLRFNEKWIYRNPCGEASRPRERIVYWQRYDFLAAFRVEQDGRRIPESPGELLAPFRGSGHG